MVTTEGARAFFISFKYSIYRYHLHGTRWRQGIYAQESTRKLHSNTHTNAYTGGRIREMCVARTKKKIMNE